MRYILIFLNTHNALNCEKVLIENKINLEVLPTPSYISNSCGISIGINEENIDKILELIENKNISVKLIYDKVNKINL